MSELLFESPGALAARVREGELSARELVEASLRRIDEITEREEMPERMTGTG